MGAAVVGWATRLRSFPQFLFGVAHCGRPVVCGRECVWARFSRFIPTHSLLIIKYFLLRD